MSAGTPESQIQEIREQLNLQAEAILKLVELVSALEGVDSVALSSHAGLLRRVRGDVIAASRPGPPAPEPALTRAEPAQPAKAPDAPNPTESRRTS